MCVCVCVCVCVLGETDIKLRNIISTSLVVQWFSVHLPTQGHEFDPWSGESPCCGQASPCATATEASRPRARALQEGKLPQ